jgi:hypothetical protein
MASSGPGSHGEKRYRQQPSIHGHIIFDPESLRLKGAISKIKTFTFGQTM